VNPLTFEEMVDYMRTVASYDQVLSDEERNLVSVAFRHVIAARREDLGRLSSISDHGEAKGIKVQTSRECHEKERGKIGAEFVQISTDMVWILDKHEISSTAPSEARVIYYKM
jgi:hypothetical protein